MLTDNSALGAQHVAALRAETRRAADRRAARQPGLLQRVRRIRISR